jgi:hypothetical protein
MSGKCQGFDHNPQKSSENVDYILHTFAILEKQPHLGLGRIRNCKLSVRLPTCFYGKGTYHSAAREGFTV